jgi:hypothetical protein
MAFAQREAERTQARAPSRLNLAREDQFDAEGVKH